MDAAAGKSLQRKGSTDSVTTWGEASLSAEGQGQAQGKSADGERGSGVGLNWESRRK